MEAYRPAQVLLVVSRERPTNVKRLDEGTQYPHFGLRNHVRGSTCKLFLLLSHFPLSFHRFSKLFLCCVLLFPVLRSFLFLPLSALRICSNPFSAVCLTGCARLCPQTRSEAKFCVLQLLVIKRFCFVPAALQRHS